MAGRVNVGCLRTILMWIMKLPENVHEYQDSERQCLEGGPLEYKSRGLEAIEISSTTTFKSEASLRSPSSLGVSLTLTARKRYIIREIDCSIA